MVYAIKKRDGRQEQLDLEKIHKVLGWACEGLKGVSISEIELKAKLNFFENISTEQIHEVLIKSAAELISPETPNYQYVASRLINYDLRKKVYGSYIVPSLLDHVTHVTQIGFYDKAFLESYSAEEFNFLNNEMDHDRDYNIVYVGMEQFRGKYLVQNRVTKTYYETPQFAYMLISMFLFKDYPKETRLKYVCDFYNATSQFYISLPTPILGGVRTPERQFSSCVLIESGDSLDSIFTTAHAIGRYVSKKAGIGIGAGALRSIDSPVRNGDTKHTGVIPFYKLWERAVKSCSQGGIRGGAATLYVPIWALEIEDILVLKNNKGVESNRVRHLDYGIQFSRIFYERLIKGQNITLFSTSDVPGLYDAFFADSKEFERIYTEAESNPNIRKKVVPAIDLFSTFAQERKDTGRLYLMNVDHVNEHGSFLPNVAPIKQSNLCAEITLPTKPLEHIDDPNGEIALCTLSAINIGLIKHPKEFRKYCHLAVRALDSLLDIQDYPILAAKIATMNRRPLGIGITNFAYWMAKNDLKYHNIDQDGLRLIDEYFQHWSYYIIEASIELAKEKGACLKSNETKYSQGILPVHTFKKDVNELLPHKDVMPWDKLSQDAIKYGIRNSTNMALMPCESSSQTSNSCNGFESPRSAMSVKQSKDGVLKQVVPEVRKLKNKYDYLWDQPSPEGYLKIAAIINKYIDQTGSWNTSYNPKFYPNEEIPLSELIKHLLLTYKWGLKTLYYNNTNDGAGEIEEIDQKPVEVVESEADCDSCKL